MRVGRSRLGWLLAATYLVAFVVAYVDAIGRRGTFVYDIWLDILSLPYILLVGRLLLRSPTFAVHAHEPLGLVPAVVFCSAVVFVLGAFLEHGLRSMFRRSWSRTGKVSAP